jgi:hypothetical protein
MKLLITVLAISGIMLGCQVSDGDTYTLYRSSPLDASMRIQIASFDSKDGEAYNKENCEIAEKLFENQPGVTVNYWCEKGRYRK